MAKKQLKLGAFFNFPGHHVASWRYPTTGANRVYDIDYIKELALTAERGRFDMIFFADVFGQTSSSYLANSLKLDPLIVLSAIAAVTKHIGLTATATTTYNEPFQLARKFAALDHLSKGRAGWNVVTSGNEKEAYLFGKAAHLPHANRYERAEEFVEVAKKLWSSIESDALVIDKQSGRYLDLNKIHPVDHEGQWFKVQGTLDSPATPQGHPVIVQAGSSEAGKELAAKTAEVIFTAWTTIDDAKAFYRDVKDRLAKYNRKPDDLKIMPGVYITVAKTEEEARAKREELNRYISPAIGLEYLSNFFGIDLRDRDIHDPIPTPAENSDKTNPNTRASIIKEFAERNNFTTLRELYEHIAGGRGHLELVGSVEQVADVLQAWLEQEAADGFNVMAPTFPDGLTDLVDLLIPELQRRGIYRTEYEGTTLRDHLGLAYPSSQLQTSEIHR